MIKNNKKSVTKKRDRYGYIFISPALLGMTMFFIYPFINTLQLSFQKVESYTNNIRKYVGLLNYEKALWGDIEFVPRFLSIMRELLTNLPIIILFSLFVAFILNKNIRFRGIFRGMFFLPVMLGTGYIMQQLMKQNISEKSISTILDLILPPQIIGSVGSDFAGYVKEFLSMLSTIFWKSGVQIIIFLAGLQTIPHSLYEAAKIDNASEWQAFWLITLPMMIPTVLLNIIYTIIEFCADSNNKVLEYIIKIGFGQYSNQFEFAAAMSFIFLGFIMAFIGLVFLGFKPLINNIKAR